MTRYVSDDDYPATTVTLVRARFGDDWMSGSGVLVGRNDVLTASHVIYDPTYGLADEIIVYPSYNPSTSDNVYFHFEHAIYSSQFDPDGDGRLFAGDGLSASQSGTEVDIALISLSSAIGDVYGWMEIDSSFESGQVNVTGYPGIYDFYPMQDSGNVYSHPIDDYIYIGDLEVNPGNSGGPVWYDDGRGPFVVGVVSTGAAAVDLAGHSWLNDWIVENDYFLTGEALISRNVVNGTAARDFLTGSEQADEIFAEGGNDILVGREGSDILHGGAGSDTAYFHEEGQYDYTVSGNTAEVRHLLTGDTDQLIDVERLSFATKTLALDIGIGEKAGQMYRIYQAAFDRAPDHEGLGYWISEVDAGKGDLAWVADNFILSTEFRETYGSSATVSDEAFLDLLYQNVLDRNADDEGKQYWMEELDRGFERSRVLASFSESEENHANVADSISGGILYQEWDVA